MIKENQIMLLTRFLSLVFLLIPLSFTAAEQAPDLLLAKTYQQNIPLSEYWVSEKLDGVRAYWDGENLISRKGHIFPAPRWFVKGLPKIPLDGELWLGRERFEELSGRVRKTNPDDKDWRGIQYMLFDLPSDIGTFNQRLRKMAKIVKQINKKHIQLIKQFKLVDHSALMTELDRVIKKGAEGLMLHRGLSLYQSGRNNDLLKVKRYSDAEAVVIKHIKGKGKFKGLLGSLLVETKEGKHLKIGSGFSLKERQTPPAIGSTITFKYFGLTNKGIPRFASFMRERNPY